MGGKRDRGGRRPPGPRGDREIVVALAAVQEALAGVARELADLRARVELLEAAARPLPGVSGAREAEPVVTVGGRPVRLRALPPAEWVRAMRELPDFVAMLARARVEGRSGDLSEEEAVRLMEQAVETARRWITASAAPGEEFDLDLLTVPEAEAAVATIARLNGVDEALAEFFRALRQGAAAPPRPGGPAVRGTA